MKTIDIPATEALLEHIRLTFYPRNPARFHRDRRMLLYALTWPAAWLDQRGLSTAPQTYSRIIRRRLQEIRQHGDPQRYGAYFPNYLLKTLQDWFVRHGDGLYEELKQARNAFFAVEALIAQLKTAPSSDTYARQRRHVETLANAHRILATQRRNKTTPRDHAQLELWSETTSRPPQSQAGF